MGSVSQDDFNRAVDHLVRAFFRERGVLSRQQVRSTLADCGITEDGRLAVLVYMEAVGMTVSRNNPREHLNADVFTYPPALDDDMLAERMKARCRTSQLRREE